MHHLPEMPGVIENQRLADCLATLRCASAPWKDRNPKVARDIDGDANIEIRLGNRDRHGKHLIDRCIGRIAPSASAITEHLPLHLPAQTTNQFASLRRLGRSTGEECATPGIGNGLGHTLWLRLGLYRLVSGRVVSVMWSPIQ